MSPNAAGAGLGDASADASADGVAACVLPGVAEGGDIEGGDIEGGGLVAAAVSTGVTTDGEGVAVEFEPQAAVKRATLRTRHDAD
jgi:hypothetical protein